MISESIGNISVPTKKEIDDVLDYINNKYDGKLIYGFYNDFLKP